MMPWMYIQNSKDSPNQAPSPSRVAEVAADSKMELAPHLKTTSLRSIPSEDDHKQNNALQYLA